jgi:hypothetical protein
MKVNGSIQTLWLETGHGSRQYTVLSPTFDVAWHLR